VGDPMPVRPTMWPPPAGPAYGRRQCVAYSRR
jgi:hypothetical protein